jgi:UDP-glucose 4-epimerase
MEDIQESFNDKTVLVTGGAGAIGSNPVWAQNEMDTKKIIIPDNQSSSYPWNIPQGPEIRFIHRDSLNEKNLKWAFYNINVLTCSDISPACDVP